MKSNKIRITLLIIIVVLGAVLGVKLWQQQKAKPIESVVARSKGAAFNPKVTVVEFIDLECPACAYGVDIISQYLKKYGQDIYVQVKYFPLVRVHKHAILSASFVECAALQNKFWPVLEDMMKVQKEWSSKEDPLSYLKDLASRQQVDLAQLDQCMQKDETKQAIEDDRMLGQSLGIQSTPTYFVNNKMVVGGKALIEELSHYFPEGI